MDDWRSRSGNTEVIEAGAKVQGEVVRDEAIQGQEPDSCPVEDTQNVRRRECRALFLPCLAVFASKGVTRPTRAQC